MKKRISHILLATTALMFIYLAPAWAQSEGELVLRLSRDFGYSSGTGKIQGTFSMKVSGLDDLVLVVFYIDGEVVGEATEAPFNLRFKTGSYSLGVHTLSAVGTTSDGREFRTNEHRREFVSSEDSWRGGLGIALPILGLVAGVTVLSFVIPYLMGRGKKSSLPLGAQRSYGVLGGTVCPKCGRPFARHFWGLNIGVGKLDRCPHCGKWSIVRRASPAELEAAESAELEAVGDVQQMPDLSDEEKLRRDLDRSRYEDI